MRKDLVFAVAASVIMGALVFDKEITRADAVILSSLFILYMWITLKGAKTSSGGTEVPDGSADTSAGGNTEMPVWKGVMWIVLGLAALVGLLYQQVGLQIF